MGDIGTHQSIREHRIECCRHHAIRTEFVSRPRYVVILIRQNDIGDDGWHAVMDRLTAITSITSLNCVDGLGELFAGTAEMAPLRGKELRAREAVVAISRLLRHCERTLTELDLRWCTEAECHTCGFYSKSCF